MGVDSAMFQAKCARGFTYFNSKAGVRHPALRKDIITPLIRGARQLGMDVCLYFCVTSDRYCTDHLPETWLLDQNGKLYTSGVVCINGHYRKRSLSILREMAEQFDFDALFLDGPDPGYVFYAPCYCDACLRLWRKRYHKEMPRDVQISDRARLLEFHSDNCREFVKEAREVVRAIRPNVKVTHNSSYPVKEDDYAFHEVDAYHRNFYRPGLYIKNHVSMSGDKPRVYSLTMDKPVRHSESREMIAWEMATIISHQPQQVMLWSTPDLSTMWYCPEMEEKVRWAVETVAGLRDEMSEPMAVISDVAIGHSFRDLYITAISSSENAVIDDVAGLHRLLSESHVPFKYVSLDVPVIPDDFRVLAIGPIQHVVDKQIQLILNWVKKGGRLIVTGDGPLARVLPGLKIGNRVVVPDTSTWCGRTPSAYCRPSWCPRGDEWSIARGYWTIESFKGWHVIGQIVPQSIYRKGWHFDNSHRPSRNPSDPAILHRILGKGQVIYFNHEVFAESLNRGVNLFRDIIPSCLKKFSVVPRFDINGSMNIEANYFRTKKGYKVVLTNGFVGRPIHGDGEPAPWIEISEVVTLADVRVISRVPARSVRSKQLGDLPLKNEPDGSLSVTLPRFRMWDVLRFES